MYIYVLIERERDVYNIVYMVFVEWGIVLDPMFLLRTVVCLWIQKSVKLRKAAGWCIWLK